MGPREEDNSVLLLGAVALICGLITFVPWLLEPNPALAAQLPERLAQRPPVEARSLAPARVIVPFTPNSVPSDR